MNYIYDIVLNFHKNYYQIYEWNKKDKIKNIAKIPVYRVSDEDIINFKNNIVRIDTSFLEKIKKDNKKNNICLVSNTKLSIGLLFDNKGYLLKRSSLIYEEEDEVNELSQKIPITKIKYLENKKQEPRKILRLEIERKNTILEYINKLEDIEILKYLYYEYFSKESSNKEIMKKELIKELKKNWTKRQNHLYHTVNLLNKKNSFTK